MERRNLNPRGRDLSFLPGLAALGLGWAALGWADFPRPHVDDAFFTGTAISLAGHHGLHNPWLGRWMRSFGTDFFWVQPPFHPWLLALWLRLFHVSAHSLLAFQCLVDFAASAAVFRLLRQGGLGWAKSAGVLLLLALMLLGKGFRPDGAGLACAALAALCWRQGGLGWWFLGCLLGAAAPLIHPFALTLVIPLGLESLFWPPPTAPAAAPRSPRLARLALGAGAGALILILFLLSIDFRFTEFCHTFLQHAHLRTPHRGQRFAPLWEQMTLGWEPILRDPPLILFAVVLAVALRNPATRRRAGFAAGLFGGFTLLGFCVYAPYLLSYACVLAMLASALLIENGPARPRRRLFSYLWWALVAVAAGPFLLDRLCCRPVAPNAPIYAQLRLEAVGPSVRILEFDEYALRYVFAYQPPARAEDWIQCCTGADHIPISLAAKPRGEAWLVDARKLEWYVPDAAIRAEHVRLFGRSFATLVRRPGELHFLP